MANSALDIRKGLTGIALEPVPIEGLGHDPKLDNEVSGEVLGLDFAPLFAPEPDKSGFVLAHDYAGVGAADETFSRMRVRQCVNRTPSVDG